MLEGSKSLHVSTLGKETQTSKKANRCLNPLACMSSLASADLFASLLRCSLEISWSIVIKEIIINDNNINNIIINYQCQFPLLDAIFFSVHDLIAL
mgnify:CR=1 FL=1